MMQISQSLEPDSLVGERVRVRRQPGLVTRADAYDACTLVTLADLDHPANGSRHILTPFDRIERLAAHRRIRKVRRACWRRACRGLIASGGSGDILRSVETAGIDLMPHQLEPALAIVRGEGCRVLIADDVGLGKTIQAGVILSELLSRGAAERVLVLTPAGLREQWVDELKQRFGLDAALLDFREIARRRFHLPVGVNPWKTERIVVASIDYIKRPEVLPAVADMRWDVVVIDEAHHVAAGTDRQAAVADVARLAAYVILLTATPHSGDAAAFAALCATGALDDRLLMFRRTRATIGWRSDRRVHQLVVRTSPAERHMHACLAAFVRAVLSERGRRDPEAALGIAVLRKRALSSAFALARSVRRRLDSLGDRRDDLVQLSLPLDDPEGELDHADQTPAWNLPALRDEQHERSLLERLANAAEAAAARESKIEAIRRLLRRLQEPVVIFTEYRDTLVHVRDRIAPEASIVHGGLTRPERRAELERFVARGVLLATDAAGEGLNLHHACRVVINLELPWNPVRLEQRIGRVDRIGQRRRVHAFHLIASGTSEGRMLERLTARVRQAQRDIGAANPLGPSSAAAAPAPADTIVRADTDAVRESRRLTLARALTKRGMWIPTVGEGPRVTRFGRASRRNLAGHLLLVLRSSLANHTGRVVASHLTPLLLPAFNADVCSLESLDALRAHVTDPALDEWRRRTQIVHEAFWTCRRERETAIRHQLLDAPVVERQAGLFDRRIEREADGASTRAASALAEADSRVRTIERVLQLQLTTLEPVLLLLP